MSDFSNYAENALGNHLLRNVSLTSPTNVYLALFTAITDAEAGTGTEVSGGSYARQIIVFGAPSNGVFLNSSQVSFPTASANWGSVTHAAIYDALTVGNPLTALKALPTPRTINTGDTLQFPVGNLSFSIL